MLQLLLSNFIFFPFVVIDDYDVIRMVWMVLRVFRVNRGMIRWTCHRITEFVFFWLRNFEHFRIVTIRNLELMVCLVAFITNTLWPWLHQSTFSFLHKLLLLWWISILTLLKEFRVRRLIFFVFILSISIFTNICDKVLILCHNMVIFSLYFDILFLVVKTFSWIIFFILNLIISSQKGLKRNIRLSRLNSHYFI